MISRLSRRSTRLTSSWTQVVRRSATRLTWLARFVLLLGIALPASVQGAEPAPGSNPLLRDVFTADPAPLVVGDTAYLYVGHDEAKGDEFFRMNDWRVYSSRDLKHWTSHGAIMKPTDFSWAVGEAWASQAVERNGRFYLYTTVTHDNSHPGRAIGVAVADNPLGPFKDARGSALVTDTTTPGPYGWDDIDPTVLVDDDGTAWLAWGNPVLHLARLKPNMTELDGPIENIALPNYTEGPWLSKRQGIYYLTYAAMAHQGVWEHLAYATAPSPRGPWTYRGIITGPVKNSYTIHPGLLEFKGRSYLLYHNGTLTLPDGETGAGARRSVTIEYLDYGADGSIFPITQTEAGISVPPRPGSPATTIDYGRSDPTIRVQQFVQGYPSAWPGKPALASVTDPFNQAPEPIGFTYAGGLTRIAQTFVPSVDMRLSSVSLYAGDGLGTADGRSLRLSLRELGDGDSIDSGAERLGRPDGLAVAYQPQGAGLLSFELVTAGPVDLKAGHRYVLELKGEPRALTLYLRASRSDLYADGIAYGDGQALKTTSGTSVDLAFALYEKP
ncbi:MAG TPA: glycoside hydrolase family 43 protein [Asticcacaulis sp.]|nr:glycoside hydrolase family 43 protein [Asticcacaulis sp.]